MLKIVLISLALTCIVNAKVAEWSQCGGWGYNGDKTCNDGLECVFQTRSFWRCEKPGKFQAKDKKLYDGFGNEFLIRGVNSANADWDNFNRFHAIKSFKKMSELGANTVRIQWRIKQNDEYKANLTIANLENAIIEAIENKMIAIVQLHDATGSNDQGKLQECAQWFANNAWLFNKYKKYVLINIANEWSQFGTQDYVWQQAYEKAISIIRPNWNGVLIIDAPAYAQDPRAIVAKGKYLVDFDKGKNGGVANLIFSVHAYAQWRKGGDYKVEDYLPKIQEQGLTFIFGEFANQHPDNCQWVWMDSAAIMRESKNRNIGYLGWSWAGNGEDCQKKDSNNNYIPKSGISLEPLNLITGDQNQLSTWTNGYLSGWGKELFESENGIQKTGKRASYFK